MENFLMNTFITKTLFNDVLFDDIIVQRKTEINDNGNEFLMVFQVPGLSSGDISITIDENKLKIVGESEDEHSIKIKKTYQLPSGIKENEISAEVKNGILKIAIPKDKQKQLTIKVT